MLVNVDTLLQYQALAIFDLDNNSLFIHTINNYNLCCTKWLIDIHMYYSISVVPDAQEWMQAPPIHLLKSES